VETARSSTEILRHLRPLAVRCKSALQPMWKCPCRRRQTESRFSVRQLLPFEGPCVLYCQRVAERRQTRQSLTGMVVALEIEPTLTSPPRSKKERFDKGASVVSNCGEVKVVIISYASIEFFDAIISSLAKQPTKTPVGLGSRNKMVYFGRKSPKSRCGGST